MLMVLIKKELRRVFFDKRLVFSAFILPALSIFILYTIMGKMMGGMMNDIETHVPTVYIQNVPESFVNYYDTVNASKRMILKYNIISQENIKEEVKLGNVDLFIVFEDDFDEKVIKYKDSNSIPEIKTYYNPSKEYSSAARNNFINDVLASYKEDLLIKRFGNVENITAFTVDTTNKESAIVDDNKAAGTSLSMLLPMLLAIILFSGAMGIGIDTIAGEKERGTMATLLLTPVSREIIALGKVISLGIVAVISALCSFVAIIASMPNASDMISGGEKVNFSSLSLSPLQYAQLLIIMISLVGIYVGVICLVSVKANSIKEASTYTAPIFTVVMVAAFSTMFSSGNIELYKFAIPVMGNVLIIKKIFMFELGMSEFLLSTTVSLILAGILIKMITFAFNSEETMFNV
jgi:sodium transport system permease protein